MGQAYPFLSERVFWRISGSVMRKGHCADRDLYDCANLPVPERVYRLVRESAIKQNRPCAKESLGD